MLKITHLYLNILKQTWTDGPVSHFCGLAELTPLKWTCCPAYPTFLGYFPQQPLDVTYYGYRTPNQFIWAHKYPQINRLTLHTPRLCRCLGLPELLAYYQVAQITQLVYTTVKGPSPQWVSIEALSCLSVAHPMSYTFLFISHLEKTES